MNTLINNKTPESIRQFLEKTLNGTEIDPFIIDTSNETHESHLWLLILDLIIFSALTYMTYTSSKRIKTNIENPDDFRPRFIKGLIYANGSIFLL